MKYELRQMREQGNGAVVNFSSIGGLIGLPGRVISFAAKHGAVKASMIALFEMAEPVADPFPLRRII
jgi:short-subunit dehydrogenase